MPRKTSRTAPGPTPGTGKATNQEQAIGQGEEHLFVPPEGWTRSANRSTSRFAFEMNNTTGYYVNDGEGTGYFAPGWDAERLARKTGVFRQAGLVLAALIIAGSLLWIHHVYETRDEYAWLKANGVRTPATVAEVMVDYETDRYHHGNSSSGWDYITETTAQIRYAAEGATVEQTINDTGKQKKTFPEPEWVTGEVLQLYVDPQDGSRFVLFDGGHERDLSRSMPLEAKAILIVSGVLMFIPLFLFLAGRKNVREARKL